MPRALLYINCFDVVNTVSICQLRVNNKNKLLVLAFTSQGKPDTFTSRALGMIDMIQILYIEGENTIHGEDGRVEITILPVATRPERNTL